MSKLLRHFFSNLLSNSHGLFVLIAIPAIVMFLGVLPPAWGLDEQVHTARAYQVSEGNWYPDTLMGEGRFGGVIPVSLEAALSHGHRTSNSVNREASFVERMDDPNPSLTKYINARSIEAPLVEYDFGPTGPYAPTPYVPSAVGFGIGRIFDLSVGASVLTARLLQAIFYITIVVCALWLLRNSRVKWVVFLVALLPASIYQAVTINADAYTIAVNLLFSAILYRMFTRSVRESRRWWILLGIVSVALVFTKPSYALLLALIPFIPRAVFGSKRQSLIIKTGILSLSAVILLLISLKGLEFGSSILLYRDAVTAASISLTDQLIYILSHPIQFLITLAKSVFIFANNWGNSVVGLLGYNTISTPFPLMILAYVSMAIASIYAKTITKKQAWWIIAIVAVASLSIVVLLYGTFNKVGAEIIEGVQGRYFIPLVPLLLIAIGRLVPIKVQMTDKSAGLVFLVVSTLILYGTTLAYVIAVV